MLNTIIKASSDENSIVMDCFARSGGTLVEANLLNRQWIGIDQSEIAIKTIKKNLIENALLACDDSYEFLNLRESVKSFQKIK